MFPSRAVYSHALTLCITLLMSMKKDPSQSDLFNLNRKVMLALVSTLRCSAELLALMMRLGEGELPRLCVSLLLRWRRADECGGERNWWVKHLPPEELYLQLRATVVHVNYPSCTWLSMHLFYFIFFFYAWPGGSVLSAWSYSFFLFHLFFFLSKSSNIIGSVLDSWSLWLLCKPEVLLPLAAALFPWAMGDT